MLSVKRVLYYFGIVLVLALGIYIRLKWLLLNNSFWHDECALAWNIKYKNFWDLVSPLQFNQIAPPFFLMATKFLTKFLGMSEYVFRLIPFIFGCASIPLFYLLAKKVLNKNFTVFIAFIFFTLNTNLIKYSFDFKPYELDVFFTVVCLLILINLDLKELSIKKVLFRGVLLAIMPWLTLPIIFVITAGLANLFLKHLKINLNLFKNGKLFSYSDVFVKQLVLMIPFLVSMSMYVLMFILNSYVKNSYLISFWDLAFINKGFIAFIKLFSITLDYLFQPITSIALLLILFFIGCIWLIRKKNDFFSISMLALLLLIIASSLKVYPFASRLVLFLFPMFLLIIVKPLDLISFDKKSISIFLVGSYIILFLGFPKRVEAYFTNTFFDRGEHPREMVNFLVQKLKSNDIIYVNNSSDADFEYYSSFYHINNKVIQETVDNNITESEYFRLLNRLKKGDYWIFAPIDYTNVPTLQWFKNWSYGKKVLYNQKNNNWQSELLYMNL